MSNKKTAERILIEVWNQGKLDLLPELVAENYVSHDSSNPFASEKGPDAVRKLVGMYHEAFPNTTFSIREQFEDGDKVITRWNAKGTHKGPLMGVPPTGKDVDIDGIGIDRFENGKVVESWASWNQLAMLQQLGVIPEMG